MFPFCLDRDPFALLRSAQGDLGLQLTPLVSLNVINAA